MKKLSLNPLVLQALQQEYPTPINAGDKALKKYLQLLQRLVNNSMIFGRDVLMREKGLYTIRKNLLSIKGGCIGGAKRGKKIRVHKWLSENGFSLVDSVIEGNGKSKKLSVIKLTSLVTVEDLYPTVTAGVQALSSDEIALNEFEFLQEFPDIAGMSYEEYASTFDTLEVDVNAVELFYRDVVLNSIDGDNNEKLKNQTARVLRLVRHNYGFLPQRKKLSPFGRCYYEGVSVQNVHKELRSAMLGNCWDYDLKSSVFGWKMAQAKKCHEANGGGESFDDFFLSTLYYLEWKEEMFNDLRQELFGQNHPLSVEKQTEKLKSVFTAISFGAKANCMGWYSDQHFWVKSTIANILGEDAVMNRFLNSYTVQKFAQEQNTLDKFMLKQCKKNDDLLLANEIIKTPMGRTSSSKVIAYMYQHGESELMNAANDFLVERDYEVIARVHDGIFVRQQIAPDDLAELQQSLADMIDSRFVRFGEKRITAYASTQGNEG